MNKQDMINDPLYQRLFRIFSYFADLCPSGTLTPSQAHFILFELQKESSQPTHSRLFVFDSECITFRELLSYIQILFPEKKDLEPLLDRLFERQISHVVKKGFVMFRRRGGGCNPLRKKGAAWRSVWLSVSPGVLHICNSDNVKEKRTVVLDRTWTVEAIASESPNYEWVLHSKGTQLFFSHYDSLHRAEYIRDIQLAITYRTRSELTEYDRGRAARMPAQRNDRDVAWRLALEAENKRLSQKLDEERRALKDEEIVRNLATRMLEEERDKSDHLRLVLQQLEDALLKEGTVVNSECTTVQVQLERIEEEAQDEVEVREVSEVNEEVRDDESYQPETTDKEMDRDEEEMIMNGLLPSDQETWSQHERDQYLIISTQSI